MDEEALIDQTKAGDLDAYNRLVLEYQSLAFNVALRIMGDGPSASDATQEAFISAYENLEKFRGGSFKAWLLRILTNACYDEHRRRKRRASTSLDEMQEMMDGLEGDDSALMQTPPDPEASVERGELVQAIRRCLDQLTLEFRSVVVLADVQEMDYKQVSQVLKIPLGTVKSRLARARARLQECLQGHGELLPPALRLEDEASP